jgi:hypothetical protein
VLKNSLQQQNSSPGPFSYIKRRGEFSTPASRRQGFNKVPLFVREACPPQRILRGRRGFSRRDAFGKGEFVQICRIFQNYLDIKVGLTLADRRDIQGYKEVLI